MTDFKNFNDAIMSLNENYLLLLMLYGNKNFDTNMNISVLTLTIKFNKDSERLDQLFLTIIKTILFLLPYPCQILKFKLFIYFFTNDQ